MCQVVAYRRLKTIENSKTFQKSGRGRFREVVVYESFLFKAFDSLRGRRLKGKGKGALGKGVLGAWNSP